MVDDFQDTNKLKTDFIFWGLYSIFIAILAGIGFVSLTAGGGFTEFTDLSSYLVFSIGAVTFWIFLTAITFGKHLFKLKVFQNLYVFGYNPEFSPFAKLSFFKKLVSRPVLLILISLIIFSLAGLVSSVSPQSSLLLTPFELGEQAQQTTQAGKVFFALYASPSENGFLFIILSILVSIELIIASRLKFSKKATYIIMILPNAIVGAFSWLVVHALVTGASQFQSLGHWFFGFINSILTMTTGLTLFTEVYHLINNLFFTLKSVFSSEFAIAIFAGLLVVSILLTVFYGIISLRRKAPDLT